MQASMACSSISSDFLNCPTIMNAWYTYMTLYHAMKTSLISMHIYSCRVTIHSLTLFQPTRVFLSLCFHWWTCNCCWVEERQCLTCWGQKYWPKHYIRLPADPESGEHRDSHLREQVDQQQHNQSYWYFHMYSQQHQRKCRKLPNSRWYDNSSSMGLPLPWQCP